MADGATLTGNWDPEGNHGRGANAFRVFSKSAYNNTGIQIIGFKLVDGATPTTDKESGNATPGCGGCVCGKGAHDRVTLRNCLIAGGSAGEGGGAFMCRIENCVVTNDEFCIYTDPKFVNAASGDYVPKARACRNSAVVYDWMTDPADVRSKDLAGNARLADTAPDMGCYELQLGGFFILIQ